MTCIVNDVHIVKDEFELVLRDTVWVCLALTSLFLISDLNLGLKNLGLELALVVRFNAEALVI